MTYLKPLLLLVGLTFFGFILYGLSFSFAGKDVSRFDGVTDLLEIESRELYGSSGYDTAEPDFKGYEFKYYYDFGGKAYEKKVFLFPDEGDKFEKLIRTGSINRIKVRFDSDDPERSILVLETE
jgi:hypothetical protein